MRITRQILKISRLLSVAILILANLAVADDRISESEPSVDGGYLMLSNGHRQVTAVQLDARMDVSVTGLLAQMTLTQHYKNGTDEWMQARYLFPLPEKATVQALTIHTSDSTIHGKIMQRDEARETFEAASETGQITALVEQQRPNLFTMDVATVAPNSELSVTLTVMLPIQVDKFSHSITLPTTHTPRYKNNQTNNPASVTGAFVHSSISRGPRLDMQLSVDGLVDHAKLSSDSHTLAHTIDAVTLSDIPMDRDVVIRWPNEYADSASSQIFIAEHSNERYAQIVLNPPENANPDNSLPRELILVIDKSGSMAGESIRAARTALLFALDNLRAEDYFNIIAFDDRSIQLFAQARIATDDNLQQARSFTRKLDADGGTEMQDSLRAALKTHPDTDKSRFRQIVFLTDGSVGYEDALLLDIERQIGTSRLFTVGIGSAPNQWFLNKAAEYGRGAALTISQSESAADAILSLLGDLANPVVTDLSIQFIGGHGEAYPRPAPDLYASKPQMLVAKLGIGVSQIQISGTQWINGSKEPWKQNLSIKSDESATVGIPATKLFWTRLKVDDLLNEQRYAADENLHKGTIIQLALNAQLLTPYTSFVAVQEVPVRAADSVQIDTEVASLIPHGNQMMGLAIPQGAAGVDTLVLLSILLGLIGIGFITISRLNTTTAQ